MVLPITLSGSSLFVLTNSNTTKTLLSGSIPQSSVRKCIILLSSAFPFPLLPLGVVIIAPLVHPNILSSSTFNATRKYKPTPLAFEMLLISAVSSTEYTRRRKSHAKLLMHRRIQAEGKAGWMTSSKSGVMSRIFGAISVAS